VVGGAVGRLAVSDALRLALDSSVAVQMALNELDKGDCILLD